MDTLVTTFFSLEYHLSSKMLPLLLAKIRDSQTYLRLVHEDPGSKTLDWYRETMEQTDAKIRKIKRRHKVCASCVLVTCLLLVIGQNLSEFYPDEDDMPAVLLYFTSDEFFVQAIYECLLLLILGFSLRRIHNATKKTRFTKIKVCYMAAHWTFILVVTILLITESVLYMLLNTCTTIHSCLLTLKLFDFASMLYFLSINAMALFVMYVIH